MLIHQYLIKHYLTLTDCEYINFSIDHNKIIKNNYYEIFKYLKHKSLIQDNIVWNDSTDLPISSMYSSKSIEDIMKDFHKFCNIWAKMTELNIEAVIPEIVEEYRPNFVKQFIEYLKNGSFHDPDYTEIGKCDKCKVKQVIVSNGEMWRRQICFKCADKKGYYSDSSSNNSNNSEDNDSESSNNSDDSEDNDSESSDD